MEMFRNSGLFELYGSSEAGWVTMLRPHEQFTKLGSVGRECVGSAPIRLLDPNGNEVPDGSDRRLTPTACSRRSRRQWGPTLSPSPAGATS
jgi:fatty-acyl-CoA synthase